MLRLLSVYNIKRALSQSEVILFLRHVLTQVSVENPLLIQLFTLVYTVQDLITAGNFVSLKTSSAL